MTLISGDTGVQIFFTLSGFLITLILLFERKEGRISLKKFYIRRFLRLIPPLILFYIFVLVLMNFGLIGSNYKGVLYSIFYVYNFVPQEIYSGELAHTWSLSLEEQFYFSWPLFIYLFRKNKYLISIAILFVLFSFLLVYIYTVTPPEIFMPYRRFIPGIGPIMFGSLSAIIYDSKKILIKEYFIENYKILSILLLIFLYPLYCPIKLINFTFLIHGCVMSIFLIWILANQKNDKINLIDYRVLNYVGKISYGIYVYQGLFLKTGPGGINRLEIQKFPLNILLVFFMAVWSYEILEKPIIGVRKKFR